MQVKTANEPITAPVVIPSRLAHRMREGSKSFALTFLVVALLAAFLLPLLRITMNSFKTPAQIAEPGTPLYPAKARTLTYDGKEYEIYKVPFADGVRELAISKKGRATSEFIDPANPSAPPIVWEGSWRAL